jgi:hypothetical protein
MIINPGSLFVLKLVEALLSDRKPTTAPEAEVMPRSTKAARAIQPATRDCHLSLALASASPEVSSRRISSSTGRTSPEGPEEDSPRSPAVADFGVNTAVTPKWSDTSTSGPSRRVSGVSATALSFSTRVSPRAHECWPLGVA